MSLFKLKNLWIQSFPQQEFDQKHLCLGKIDNKPALGLASFTGNLRVYVINQIQNFQISLIYQTKFQSPIINIQFVIHPQEKNKNTIGVLLHRKFVYMSLRKNAQTNNYEAKNLQINTEPAFAIQKQSVSLMTLNSTIQYLNPISVQTIKVSDPIYPFARRQNSIYYGDGQELVMMQNSAQQWRIIMGPMRSIHLTNDQTNTIVIIGDNALWQVAESHITKTKVMEEDVSCGTVIFKENGFNILVANFANQIFIYTSNYQLIWAMKADQVPVKVCIFNTGQLMGALAFLGEQGTVSISYLGSELPQVKVQEINQDIYMQQVQDQTRQLLQQIKLKSGDGQALKVQQQTENKGDVKFIMKPKNPKKSKMIIDNGENYYKKDGQLWCCEVQCTIKPQKQPIYEVSLTISLPSNITCTNKDKRFSSIKGIEKFDLILLCSGQKFPYENHITVAVRYESADKNKGSCIVTESCELPFDFQCNVKSLQLQQKPANKIVFKANNNLPALSEIFYEFGSTLGNSKNLTIKLANGVLCSMGYNKDNTKVKIQSNFFSGLCFMFAIFSTRFDVLIKSKKIAANQLTVDIPLQQFFSVMKQHFQLRVLVKQKYELLQKKCEQFRNTQKKLLIKMKQKVSSINNIDKLLQYTYKKLIQAADSFEHTREQLQAVNHNLDVAITFVMELLFLKTKATTKCRQKVQGIMAYQKQSTEFGWEQKVMSSSAHFLNKKFNFTVDKYTFDQLYKTILWVISKVNSGEWNQ